jgi:RND superfamily putative drug exporter
VSGGIFVGKSGAMPTPHRRWLLPVVLLLLWLAVGALGGPFTGKLSQVATNDDAAFLPATAESTRVSQLQRAFVEQETVPAIVVWESRSGIGPETSAQITRQVEAMASVPDVVGRISPPVPSEDGRAVTVVVPFNADLGDEFGGVIGQLRDIVASTSGASAYVTGPAGFIADLEEAFAGIDGLLLLVALIVVFVILLLVYRSPILPVLVLFSSVLGLVAASSVVYWLAKHDVVTLNGQSQGIMSILVVGAATDYALLIVARFREELREEASPFAAMRIAWRQSAEPVAASGTTVILGVLCLLFSDLNSNRGLGPIAALGIAGALIASLTFLPSVLVLLGRAAFWPFAPRFGSPHPEESGIWGRVARLIARRPRRLWIGVAVVLAAAAAFVPTLSASGVPQSELFLSQVQSKLGEQALARHFPGGAGTPVVVIAPEEKLDDTLRVVSSTSGVSGAVPLTRSGAPGQGPPKVADGHVEVEVTLRAQGSSEAGLDTVRRLRADLDAVGPDVLVGGAAAQQLDTFDISTRDRTTIIPIVLVVILVVLMILLRSVLAPVLLVLTVVASFLSTLGVAALVFDHVLGWPGADPAIPLFGFVFLVALGIDYNIFLMTRVREESARLDTRRGILRGLAVTGGVITSAGVVLAATFSALGVIPILFLGQIAFIVAFGVLLDTFVVRSLLVPALCYDIGSGIWWPSRLARSNRAD